MRWTSDLWWLVGGGGWGGELVCMDAREGVSSCAGVCVSACLSVFQVLAVHPISVCYRKALRCLTVFCLKMNNLVIPEIDWSQIYGGLLCCAFLQWGASARIRLDSS